MHKVNESGFTLIELMVVMVVLGILAGIVLFAVGAFREQAAATRATVNERTCAVAQAAADASASKTRQRELVHARRVRLLTCI